MLCPRNSSSIAHANNAVIRFPNSRRNQKRENCCSNFNVPSGDTSCGTALLRGGPAMQSADGAQDGVGMAWPRPGPQKNKTPHCPLKSAASAPSQVTRAWRGAWLGTRNQTRSSLPSGRRSVTAVESVIRSSQQRGLRWRQEGGW